MSHSYIMGLHTQVVDMSHAAREVLGGEDTYGVVCEIGFNSGHSTLNWLLSTGPNVKVIAFDLGYHPYVPLARDYL
ncbi:unnamed protein product, partial [Choristocarpus tenellus]